MSRWFSPKVSGVMGALLVIALGASGNSWAGSKRIFQAGPAEPTPGMTVEVVGERDFDSFDELLDWLQGVVDMSGDDGVTLGHVRREMGVRSHGCVCPIASPASIVVPRPPFIKLFQLNFNTSFGVCGSCGLVICARLAYQLVFAAAPPAGAFLLGPMPRATREEVCVGQTVSAKAFLVLTNQVSPGQYLIRFEATGAGDIGIATVFVTVQ